MKGNIYIISSPSGAGKSSLLKALFEKYNSDNSMYLSVSQTTRPPRVGEVNGSHYHFVNEDEFKTLIDKDAFYEWAHVFDKYYGTSKLLVKENIEQGRDVFLDIDWQGARQIREQEKNVKSIFILPPSLEELNNRLHQRGQDSEEVIASRMQKAQREISHYNEYDYCLINDNFDECLSKLWAIITANRNLSNPEYNKNINIIKSLLENYDK